MATVVNSLQLDGAGLAALLEPRRDVVIEGRGDDGSFVALEAPFSHYRRLVEAVPLDEPDPATEPGSDAGARFAVTETTTFSMAVPLWGPLFVRLYKRELRRTSGRGEPRRPAWAPPDQLDARSSKVLGLLCSTALVAGYLGTVVTQTITFAAQEFGASKSAQANTLSNVRVGALLALLIVAAADRRGRRGLLLFAAAGGCVVTSLGALAPSLLLLGVNQVVASGLTTSVLLLVTIIAAEEMPAGSRAYAVSMMTMAGALGAGMCLWALPLADVSESGWRILYVLALLGLPIVVHVGRHLPESRRFVAPHMATTVVHGHSRRFWVLGISLFLISTFGAPATQLLNEFLRSERGFSAGRISAFTILTSTPGAIGLLVGGRVADVRGRRVVVTTGVVLGSLFTVFSFSSFGWQMWMWNLVGTVLGAAASPALAMYGPELFPTGSRGRASGAIRIVSVAGSFVGLRLAGRLADRVDLAYAMKILMVGPLVVGLLVLFMFPETAHRELEEMNPEDSPLASPP